MKTCTKCFEVREMFHGRCCEDCRKKYLQLMQKERSRKKCPVCGVEHNEICKECCTRCKILNRYETKNGCWEWQGKIGANGYGILNIRENGKKMDILTHRESYRIFKGEIPDGMYVLHKCDNRSCINPDHLWVGTGKENVQDCIKKGRFCNGHERAKISGKLTEHQVMEMREMYSNGFSPKELQEKFKVSQSQVSGILTYRFWKHV